MVCGYGLISYRTERRNTSEPLPVVATTTDGAPDATENPKDGTYDGQNGANAVEDRDTGEGSDDYENDSCGEHLDRAFHWLVRVGRRW